MRRALVAVTLLLAVGGAYAAGAFGGGVKSDLRLTRSVRCRSNHDQLAGPKAFSRFHAVTAVLCTEGSRIYRGQGQWEVRIRKVAVSGIPAWQRYFEQPSEPNLPQNGVCTANLVVLEVPVFVDGSGRTLVPRTPVDRCGHPLGLAKGEKPTRVRWHVVSVHRIKQVITAAAVAANCPMKWGDSVAWAGPPRDSKGGALFDRAPRTVGICVYRTPPNSFATGTFVRGFRLGASRTSRLLEALTGPGPRRGCPKQRTFAVVGASHNSGAEVELGGCYRVERADRLAGTANPAVIRLLLGRR